MTDVLATPILDTSKALEIRDLQVTELALKNKIMEFQIQHSSVLAKLSGLFAEVGTKEGFKLNPATLKYDKE